MIRRTRNKIKMFRWSIVLLLSGAVLVGCSDETEKLTEPGMSDTPPALAAAAQSLTFRQISPGINHTCGVTTDDRAFCWGSNWGGALGIGAIKPIDDFSTTPAAVAGGLRFRMVSVGTYHSCGLTTGDLAYCWGQNRLAQLGDGSRTSRTSPVPVAGGRRFRHLRVGDVHTCAVTYADAAFCWGDNSQGQLGNGTTTGPLRPVRVAGGLQLRRAVAGGAHTCGWAPGGKTYCWGSNSYGQLGDGTTTQRLQPAPVAGGLLFNQLGTGNLHSCGVSNGRAYCWGRNRWGQLGDGTMTRRLRPTPVAGGLRFAGVSAGHEYTCGVTTGSRAYCWGLNQSGRLGDGSVNTIRLTPVAVSGGLLFAGVNASVVGRTTCGVTTGAKGYCWGDNWVGQVGDGTYANTRFTPVAVAGPS